MHHVVWMNISEAQSMGYKIHCQPNQKTLILWNGNLKERWEVGAAGKGTTLEYEGQTYRFVEKE